MPHGARTSDLTGSKTRTDRPATHASRPCLGQLSEWWPETLLGPPPEGDSSIAIKRLVVQAQTAPAQQAVHSAFLTLPAAPLVRRGLKIARSKDGLV